MSKKNGSSPALTEMPTWYAPKEKISFGKMIYDKKNGTYFGRTPKSWGQLMLFYIIFYIILAGLFATCMQGLFSALNDKTPLRQLKDSLIGTNPGLGFRPLSEETERGSVIQFDTKKPDEGQYWVSLLDDFLDSYSNRNGDKQSKICGFNSTHNSQQVCFVDIDSFGPCTKQNSYGYKNGRPCVFLKLNKIFGWEPQYYDDPQHLPDNMPIDLQEHIGNVSQLERQQIWVSCHGQHSNDKEKMGAINYYPSRGFAAYYYPFLNQPGYLSPLIAVQFEKPKVNEMVTVECRAWAKNIIYSGSNRDRMGSVVFQLYID
ncbi:sodium/potassium-transporting ATPase subunit beta-1 [Teleopsis dalmanni]|uniref:sodium/potassium-transporting ATPase subunit beta-1 n=1 Tax=Teleopsis dalmanni TaxID=139649 RepID=UPI0018CDFC7B|nr:sodium/potassium-transporting ATPase subunit beta-1 [Teleopsis dalmanni]